MNPKPILVMLIILFGWSAGVFLMTSATGATPTINKQYQKGYDKGYADAEAKFSEGLAKRDSLDMVRHNQFILQMQQLAIAIEKYNKATKHIQGL